jgi:hypothetical protein
MNIALICVIVWLAASLTLFGIGWACDLTLSRREARRQRKIDAEVASFVHTIPSGIDEALLRKLSSLHDNLPSPYTITDRNQPS